MIAAASFLVPCPLVPAPTAAALVETEKGVVFSQRGGPSPPPRSLSHSVDPFSVLQKFSCRFWRAQCGGVRGASDAAFVVPSAFLTIGWPVPLLRVTRFALRHCTTSTSHPPLPLFPSLPTTTRRRSPEFPFPSSHHFRSLRRFSWPSSSSSLAAVDKLFPRRPPDCGATAVWK